jgi:predicted RNase H-like nuclease (RuvC/YqgF family)
VVPAKRGREEERDEKESKRQKAEEKEEMRRKLDEMEDSLDRLDDRSWEVNGEVRKLKAKLREYRRKL